MQGITTGTLTEERQKEVFERAMTEFKGSTIDRWPLKKRINNDQRSSLRYASSSISFIFLMTSLSTLHI